MRSAAARRLAPLALLILALIPALLPALAPRMAHAGAVEELAGLFVRACLSHAGQPAALRRWAAETRLPEVPDPARRAFLAGAAGMVFDASTPGGKFALLSGDDGVCAAVTDHADDRETIAALEAALREAGATFRLVIERDDKRNPVLHHREYLAAKGTRSWRILAATVRDGGPPGQAMLTAAPG